LEAETQFPIGATMANVHKGDRVSHERFGLGLVVEVNTRHTVIAFDQTGVRKFATALVHLDPSDAPPPAGTAGRRRPGRRRSTSSA
jgi:hypothetical protein